ncbi:hypothetical protein SAMN05443287_102476 [Micromonospora phaseoli]|uniref:LPXTG-motif cell wall anchor domain-containing protein n=1 Tax=Micromonospora phaseoli TaxID=1144548 RepID=A0A1H6V4X1_9ACTN|nr:hypothetical protein [Micromonospora phaseoli]PZV93770.1 hypothetical protein CLV64_109231 [Micromonospora phaseoli]GIJ79954.1 hypothetical protein Xph01_43860 [Micromonospora phaseoli]SEI97984.1 hypothetical protein SAMN05443287_102476 [Micromonospora phaseoli]
MTAAGARTVLVLALVGAGVLVGPVPATAAGSAGYCPDASGVTVVVDFKELGGGTVIRCAPGDQATGLAALKNAGFQIAGTLRWGEGFICRIEGKPGAGAENCVDTPPASAYWSYWHAPNGGAWAYSDKGVTNRKPPAGSFEGWSFSLNRAANNAPRPAVAPHRPAPPPPPAPTSAPPPPRPSPPLPPPVAPPVVAPPAPGGDAAPGVPAGTAPAGTTGPPATAAGSAPAGSPGTPTPPAPSATDAGATAAALAAPPADPTDSVPPSQVTAGRDTEGPPLGTLAGLLLLVALAGGVLVAARRRRTAAPDD